MSIRILIVGITGLFISLAVLFVSLLLHISNPRRVSWGEALMGIVPGTLCSLVFLIVMVVGLVLLLTNRTSSPPPRSGRFSEEDAEGFGTLADAERQVGVRATLHWVLSLVMATCLGITSLVMLFFGVVGTIDSWGQLHRVSRYPYDDNFMRASAADYFNGSVALIVAGLCCGAAALLLAFRRRVPHLGRRPWYLFLVALLPLGVGIRAWPLGWFWGWEARIGLMLAGVCLVLALLKYWSVSTRLSMCLTLTGLGYTCWMIGWLTATSPSFRVPRPHPNPPRPRVVAPAGEPGVVLHREVAYADASV